MQLLEEEYRRCDVFLKSKAKQWTEQAALRDNVSAELKEGLTAYAIRQANIRGKLADKFRETWAKKHSGADETTREEDEDEGDASDEEDVIYVPDNDDQVIEYLS